MVAGASLSETIRLDYLPRDVLCRIFSCLPPGSAAALNAARASPVFARILASSIRTVCLDVSASQIAQLLSGGVGSFVETLALSFPTTCFDSSNIAAIASACQNLRCVTFSSLQLADGFNDSLFVQFVHSMSSHQHCVVEDLRVEFCGAVSGDALVEAAAVLPCLQRVTHKFSGQIHDRHVAEICKHMGTRLVELDLECSPCVSDVSLDAIATYCPNTAVLGLGACHDITDHGIHSVAAALGPSLRSLDIHDASNVTDLGVYHLACHCRNLQYVNVWRVCLTSFAISAIAETSGDSLQVLIIGDCLGIDDDGILSLSENCCVLRELEMTGINKVTDSAMLQLLGEQSVAPLTSLTIDRCGLLTDSTLHAIARNGHLAEVSAVGLPSVSCNWVDTMYLKRPDLVFKADDAAYVERNCVERIDLADFSTPRDVVTPKVSDASESIAS